jgi:hypothetical protein
MASASRHRTYMLFMFRECWRCQFLEPDPMTPLRRRVDFRDSEAMLAFALRGGCVLSMEEHSGCKLWSSVDGSDLEQLA